jgi:protein gp37
MAARSSIEWTEATWNPVTGCTKISIGCKNCYAERMAHRLQAMGQHNYVNGFRVTTHEDSLDLPLRWKSSQVVFVNSMGDLFHQEIPILFIYKVFSVMNRANWHRYQVLTKRSGRLLQLDSELNWAENIWMGVTVESAEQLHRVDALRKTRAKTKFLSLEPLLGPLPNLDLRGIDWVIVGGESGPGARPIQEDWVIEIRNQCLKLNVPFFFKQWGGTRKKKSGRLLDGRIWNEMPRVPATYL